MQHLIDRQIAGWCVNFVLWGYRRDQPIVFKYFHEPYNRENKRWENEYASLQHFSETGLVPEILAVVPKRLIVMECLPGRAIVEEAGSGELGRADLRDLGVEAGKAVGRLMDVPLPEPGDGYSIVRDYAMTPWPADLEEAVLYYVRICRGKAAFSPTAADVFNYEALNFVESQLPYFKGQKKVIHNDDLLCFVNEGRITGFYDFELSRLGTEQMQLGQVFRWCTDEGLQWPDILEGYNETTGRSLVERDYAFMLATNLLHRLIRIAMWDEAEYFPAMKKEVARFAKYVDVRSFFPSS